MKIAKTSRLPIRCPFKPWTRLFKGRLIESQNNLCSRFSALGIELKTRQQLPAVSRRQNFKFAAACFLKDRKNLGSEATLSYKTIVDVDGKRRLSGNSAARYRQQRSHQYR